MNLIELKKKYPECYYDRDFDCILIADETIIAEDASEIIEEFYEGEEWDCLTSSGNPEDMVTERLTGKEYIELAFNGNYTRAFNDI